MLRLQKYLAAAGFGSRRQAEVLIIDGRVKVNGQIAELGSKVDPNADEVKVDDKLIEAEQERIVIALNKPTGFVTKKNPINPNFVRRGKDKIVFDLLPDRYQHLFPIGRLDKETSGLLLLTNDGQLTQQLTHPKYDHSKTYEALLQHPLTTEGWRQLNNAKQYILGKAVKPFIVKKLAANRLQIILTEGRNQQVRRLLRNAGSRVKKLRRVAIGQLELEKLGLAAGELRQLSESEISSCLQA